MIASRARCRRLLSAALVSAAMLMPGLADAHVKWFCGPIDSAVPPVPLRDVFTSLFFTCLAGFALAIGLGGFVDALLTRYLPLASRRYDRSAMIVDVVVRLGLAIYAICLWRNLAVVLWADGSVGSVLTPEMIDRGSIIGLLQLAIAGLVLVPRLSLLAGAGLFALYAIGVARFGPFYMIDYLFFVGLPIYIALGQPALRNTRWYRWRTSILTASLSLSLMWTAVEKFLFPQWTIAVLLVHPGVTAGFPFPTVATVAGFVEFSLAFYLLAGRAVLVRVAAILLAVVFVIAMPEFGMVDVVGHIPVLVILVATLLHGETDLQRLFRGPATAAISSGVRAAFSYVVVLALLMSLYYALHALSVWARNEPVRFSQPSPTPKAELRDAFEGTH